MALLKEKKIFPKQERLCGRKEIDRLFDQGSAVSSLPVKLLFIPRTEDTTIPCKSMFVVPKKSFRKAHDRNKLKRRMREAFRLNKSGLYQQLASKEQCFSLAFLYTGKKEENYSKIELALKECLQKMNKKI